MAGIRTIETIEAEIATLTAKKSALAGLPDSFGIGPNRVSGINSAFKRVTDTLEGLCRELEALKFNDGCPLPTRGHV